MFLFGRRALSNTFLPRSSPGWKAGLPVVVVLLASIVLSPLASAQAEQAKDARGALFAEDATRGQPLSLGWFFFGLYVLAGLIFAGCSAQLAVSKRLPVLPWFAAGLLFNAFGYLVLLTRRPGAAAGASREIPHGLHKIPATYESAPCPGCGHHNHPAAERCAGCGGEMVPVVESDVNRWHKQKLH